MPDPDRRKFNAQEKRIGKKSGAAAAKVAWHSRLSRSTPIQRRRMVRGA